MAIRVQALGTVRVERDGRVLDRLPAQRVRLGLLVYLAVEREAARESVMAVFWPDRPPERARHLLNQTLYELRQDLGDDWVRSVGEHLVVADDVVVDVAELAAAVDAGEFTRALDLYDGPFLAGALPGLSREMEGWVDGQQARVARLHRQARRGALDAAVARGDLAGALALARSWAERDPLDDEAHHRAIELMAATGDRAGALRQYDRYAALVERELELEPLDETRALVERIRGGELGPRAATAAPAPAITAGPSSSTGGERRGVASPAGRSAPWHGWPLRAAAALAFLAAAALAARTVQPAERGVRASEPLDPRRIAVLFFDDHSPAQDLGPVAAGFTDALIHELDQVDGLEVLSRTAMEAYRGVPLDSIVAALRVGTFVEGSLTRVEDSLKVTFQLVDGATAASLLSGALTRHEGEVASLSRELPRVVARQLRERLGSAVELREMRGGTESAEGWLLVQRAQILLEDAQATFPEDLAAGLALLDRSDSMLGEAERADPGWPEPTYRRAVVEVVRAGRTAAIPGQREPGAVRAAMEHLERALAKDPQHVASLEQRGILRFELVESAEALEPAEFERLRALAESDLRRAVELDAQRARAWWGLSRVLRRKGSFAEAKQAARRALAADAFLEVAVEGIFQVFLMSLEREEHAEAVEWCRELRDRHPETMRRIQCDLVLLASSPLVEPDSRRGWALVDTMVAAGSVSGAEAYRGWATLHVGKMLAREGRPDSARAVLERVVPDPPPAWAPYDAAHLLLLLGDAAGALRYLEVYLEANPEQAPYLVNDWWFRDLHQDPRFRGLVETSGAMPG